ncbi:hypothetical protein TWF696_000187 [Orbilia brochopaga]|uniref:NACHT domain-containing protein n=1 Tax=Orbilia brochopaga TaxID=3140254 RepID=A0AAV9VAN3_9PEZI
MGEDFERGDYTIGWICALPVELSAAIAVLDKQHLNVHFLQDESDSNIYQYGQIGTYNIVLARLPSSSYGVTSAAIVAANMRRSFPSITIGLMVGVAGGAPAPPRYDIRLGDVVISEPVGEIGGVLQYDFGKTIEKGLFIRTGSLNKPPAILLGAVAGLKADFLLNIYDSESIYSMITDLIRTKGLNAFTRPPVESDRSFQSSYDHPKGSSEHTIETCVQCDPTKIIKRQRRSPNETHIHYGIVASGNQVIKDGTTRDRLSQGNCKVLCFEMEAAGLMDQLPSLIIRGICDYSDSHKNKKWQPYAALTAAVVAKRILLKLPPKGDERSRPVQIDPAREAKKAKILKKLDRSPYRDRKDRNPDRVPRTCEWFTSHSLFQGWQQCTSSRLLWVSADPGCGKSVLAKYLVDSILPSTESRAVCYFFFKDDFEDQKSIIIALCCLLRQLFLQNPNLLSDEVLKRFESGGEGFSNSFGELWDALSTATCSEDAGEIILVLDGIDECEESGRSQLVKALCRLYSKCGDFRVKFLVTSRPYDDIRGGFQELDTSFAYIHLRGEGEAELTDISQEIDIFIQDRVRNIGTRRELTPSERDLLLQRLTAVPHRTYIWAQIVLDLIEADITIDKTGILEATSHLPETVNQAYEKIISKSRNISKTKTLLQTIISAARPLTLKEMNVVLALQKHPQSYSCLDLAPDERFHKTIRELCGLFITVIDSRIYLFHQTAREFLVKNSFAGSQPIPPSPENNFQWKQSFQLDDCHKVLADICIQYLFLSEFVSSEIPKYTLLTSIDPPVNERYTFLNYAAKYWATHVRESRDQFNPATLRSVLMLCEAYSLPCLNWFKIYWWSLSEERPRSNSLYRIRRNAYLYNEYKVPTDVPTLLVLSMLGLDAAVGVLLASEARPSQVSMSWDAAGSPAWNFESYDFTPIPVQILRAYSDINTRDPAYERSALSWAAANGFSSVCELLLKSSTVHHLMPGIARPNIDVNSMDGFGRTPLTYVVWNKQEPIVRLLVEGGAHVDLSDLAGGTPLSYAICHGHEGIIKILLKGEAKPSSRDEIMRNLLISAVNRNYVDVIRQLSDIEGFDPNTEDEYGEVRNNEIFLSSRTVLVG